MIGKVKALTLALVAVCAFGAVSASAASAAEFHIAGMGVATGDGTQIVETEFSIPEGPLRCANVTFNVHELQNSSSVKQETTGQTATVKVEDKQHSPPDTLTCKFAGLSGSIVHMNGCDFLIHTTPQLRTTVKCPAGQSITVTAIVAGVTKCTIHIPEQHELAGISIVNATASDIELTAAVQGITYQSTTGSGLGACTNTTAGTDGKFSGKVTVQGTAGGVASALQYK